MSVRSRAIKSSAETSAKQFKPLTTTRPEVSDVIFSWSHSPAQDTSHCEAEWGTRIRGTREEALQSYTVMEGWVAVVFFLVVNISFYHHRTVIRNPDKKTWHYILLPKLNHQRAQHSQRLGQIAVEWVGQQLGDAMQIVVKYAYNNIVLVIFVITSKGKRAFKWERCNSNKDVLYRSGPWQSSTVTVALYCWVKCEFTERPPDVWRRWGDRQEGRPERPTGGVDWTQDGVHHGQDIRSGRWVACMWVAEQGTSRQLNPSSYRSVVGLGSNGIDMETLLLIKWWWLMAIIHIVLI